VRSKLLDHLLADKEMLGGVRLKFRDVYQEIEGTADRLSMRSWEDFPLRKSPISLLIIGHWLVVALNRCSDTLVSVQKKWTF
jgi:hypothetical protein